MRIFIIFKNTELVHIWRVFLTFPLNKYVRETSHIHLYEKLIMIKWFCCHLCFDEICSATHNKQQNSQLTYLTLILQRLRMEHPNEYNLKKFTTNI